MTTTAINTVAGLLDAMRPAPRHRADVPVRTSAWGKRAQGAHVPTHRKTGVTS